MLVLKKAHIGRKIVRFDINTSENLHNLEFPAFPDGHQFKVNMLLPVLKYTAFTFFSLLHNHMKLINT